MRWFNKHLVALIAAFMLYINAVVSKREEPTETPEEALTRIAIEQEAFDNF